MPDITIDLETYNRLCADNQRMREALEMIHHGNTLKGIQVFTHADVIQKHYAIARAALTEKG